MRYGKRPTSTDLEVSLEVIAYSNRGARYVGRGACFGFPPIPHLQMRTRRESHTGSDVPKSRRRLDEHSIAPTATERLHYKKRPGATKALGSGIL